MLYPLTFPGLVKIFPVTGVTAPLSAASLQPARLVTPSGFRKYLGGGGGGGAAASPAPAGARFNTLVEKDNET